MKIADIQARNLIKYLKSLGIEVSTSTKARRNQWFYLRNKIYISKNISPDRLIPTLLHEFAHYIHAHIEPFMERTGGTIEVLFDDDKSDFYKDELLKVTNFVDKNSKFERLLQHKSILKEKISEYESIIKNKYPEFLRSKKFKEFDKYIKKSDAKYLLKYDRVQLISRGLGKTTKLYSISNLEQDFPDMSKEFCAYIRLKSCTCKQSRVSAKINRMKKYYTKPTELFARFIEGLYIDETAVKELAPNCYKRFYELLNTGYYKELVNVYYSFISSKE